MRSAVGSARRSILVHKGRAYTGKFPPCAITPLRRLFGSIPPYQPDIGGSVSTAWQAGPPFAFPATSYAGALNCGRGDSRGFAVFTRLSRNGAARLVSRFWPRGAFIVGKGVYDWRHATGISAFGANLLTFIEAAQAGGGSVIRMSSMATGSGVDDLGSGEPPRAARHQRPPFTTKNDFYRPNCHHSIDRTSGFDPKRS